MEKTIIVCDKCGKELDASDCQKVCAFDLCNDCYKKFANCIKKFFEPVENKEDHKCSCGGN